jgi:threonine dehydratase
MSVLEAPVRERTGVEPVTADEWARDLAVRRQGFDTDFNGFEGYDVGQAEVVLVEPWKEHRHVVLDVSDHPGNAFKYLSALGAMSRMPEDAEVAVAASAGNYAAAVGEAGMRFGRQTMTYMPRNPNQVKVAAAQSTGMTVEAEYDDVAHALRALRQDCEANTGMFEMHPFDNPNGIAALTYLGDQVLSRLVELQQAGHVDLNRYNVNILTQRGGGSLLTAMALANQKAKWAGLWRHGSVTDVRPEVELDPLYDGLKVADPGRIAATFMRDRKYVGRTHLTSLAATADAARETFGRPGVEYEANALIGIGAYMEMREQASRPTLFVSLLTGTNTPPEQTELLIETPGLRQSPNRLGHAALSGIVDAETNVSTLARRPV